MSCIILSKAFCCFTLSSAVRKGGGRETGGRAMRAGLSGSAEEDRQFGSPRSLHPCQKHSTGGFRPKGSKWERSSPMATTDVAGAPSVAFSFLSVSPCRKVAIIWKGAEYFERIRVYNTIQSFTKERQRRGRGKAKCQVLQSDWTRATCTNKNSKLIEQLLFL